MTARIDRNLTKRGINDWIAYTPVFTNGGTPTGVEFFSRRNGDSLEIDGKFTWGTGAAAEMRVDLGFNGVNGGITSAGATKNPSGTSLAGVGFFNVIGDSTLTILKERSVGYLTFGIQNTAQIGLNKITGSSITSGTTVSFRATVPITGW